MVVRTHCLSLSRKKLLWAFLYIGALCLWCEIIVFYVKLLTSCGWPSLEPQLEESVSLRAMVLSDTHLLGLRKGHWLDKLRREWQMYISFQTALFLYEPEFVIILGDLLDEGQIATDEEFAAYSKRFYDLFSVSSTIQRVVLVGNHDIGFHDRVIYFEPLLRRRFEVAFNTSLVQLMEVKGVKFVTLNSMALDGDGCELCDRAMKRIKVVARKLGSSRPVLLLHFPLYRVSDEQCNEIDSDTSGDKSKPFREGIDCVNQESTNFVLKHLKPRLVLSGHTHHGCVTKHSSGLTEEWTVASFSWRNKPSPSFLLGKVSPNKFAMTRCMLPNEFVVITTYILGFLTIIYILFGRRKRY